MAALLHLWLRPRMNGRFLEIHGAFLLVMAPFGLHWLAQGPMLRAATGVLYGFAVVTFLWLPLASRAGETPAAPWLPAAGWRYFLGLGATLLLLPAAASAGGRIAGYILAGLIAWGALAVIGLAAADISLGVLGVLRRLRRAG